MSLYSVALFIHIVGSLLLFVLLTIEGIGLRRGFIAARLNRVLGRFQRWPSSFRASTWSLRNGAGKAGSLSASRRGSSLLYRALSQVSVCWRAA